MFSLSRLARPKEAPCTHPLTSLSIHHSDGNNAGGVLATLFSHGCAFH